MLTLANNKALDQIWLLSRGLQVTPATRALIAPDIHLGLNGGRIFILLGFGGAFLE